MKNANLVSLVFGLCALLVGPACAREETAKNAPPKTVADWFAIKIGGQTPRLQLAVLPRELERGLMERRDLGPDEGMLFVFRTPQKLSFWMRNTPTPLTIGYFRPNGELAETHDMHPYDERSVPARNDRLQFALEMNQGWFRERGVKPGAKLDLKALAAALEERGFDPRRLGIEIDPAP